MSDPLTERLNQILPKITSDAFLSGKGLGNEIAFYIFDYPPEAELRIREHIAFLLDHIPKQRPGSAGRPHQSPRLRHRAPAPAETARQSDRDAEDEG